jgi:CheY-like chemotaxis protein
LRTSQPRADEGKPPEELPNHAVPGLKKESSSFHILYIDDTEPLARLGKLFLERQGYRVTIRIDAMEGLKLFQQHPDIFGLVITDMTMPNLSGLDLARRIHEQSPKTPIVLCTGHGDIFQDAELKDAGIRSVISKPLTSIELSRAIHKVRANAFG